MLLLVTGEGTLVGKTFPAGIAFISLLLGVCHLVSVKVRWCPEHLAAVLTSVVPFSGFCGIHHLLALDRLSAGISQFVDVIVRVTLVLAPAVAL